MARGKPSRSLWERPEGSATVRRMRPWHLPPRGPWRRAAPELDCGNWSGIGVNGRRRTRRPMPLSTASRRCMPPDAGDCRPERLAIWVSASAQTEPADASEYCEPGLHAPRRWGLSAEAVAHLGDRLCQFWRRFCGCFTTRTRDTSERAYDDLRAQLTMDTERNFAHMDRTLNGGDGQALQHFMSNSPWSGPAVFEQMQAEIKATPALAQGSTLILDESADEKAGMHNVGASRQYNGRLGKV